MPLEGSESVSVINDTKENLKGLNGALSASDGDMAFKHRFCIPLSQILKAYVPDRQYSYGDGRRHELPYNGNRFEAPNIVRYPSGRAVFIHPFCQYPEDGYCMDAGSCATMDASPPPPLKKEKSNGKQAQDHADRAMVTHSAAPRRNARGARKVSRAVPGRRARRGR